MRDDTPSPAMFRLERNDPYDQSSFFNSSLEIVCIVCFPFEKKYDFFFGGDFSFIFEAFLILSIIWILVVSVFSYFNFV